MDAAISLHPALAGDAELVARLLELYCHDLSEAFSLELGDDGRFGYAKLPLYWSEPEKRFPFLVRAGGKTAGFALVTRGSPASDDPDVLDVAEFFVLRRYRRSGVGRRAAALLWDQLPGRWVVRVSDGNQGAVPFWGSTVASYTGGRFTMTLRAGSPHAWRDFSFTSPVRENP